jgi:hypothetical protein
MKYWHKTTMRRFSSCFYVFAILLCVSVSVLSTLVGFLPYMQVRSLADRFTPDGSLDAFTLAIYNHIHWPAIMLGVLLLVLAVAGMVYFRRGLALAFSCIQRVAEYLRAFWDDLKQLGRSITGWRMSRVEWGLLAVLLIAGAVGRWALIRGPMMHDESYTFIAFARRPLITIITNYHLPNNHILNSLLIHAVYSLVGNPSPAVVRFPAFLAGVLTIPAVYFFARTLYGKPVAALSASLVAFWPELMNVSASGRGYMIMTFLTVCLFITGDYVRRNKNRAAWLVLALIAVLNLYTLPTALIPISILGLWLFVSALLGDISAEYNSPWNFSKYLFLFGFSSALLTLVLYSPIFIFGTGWDSVFNNSFVASQPVNTYLELCRVRFADTWHRWIGKIPLGMVVTLVVGFFASFFLFRRNEPHKAPLQPISVLGLVLFLVIRRPDPWQRIWTFLLPFCLLWSVAGLVAIMRLIFRKERYLDTAASWMAVGGLACIFILGTFNIQGNLKSMNVQDPTETVAIYLGNQLQEGDIVVISSEFSPAMWYYFDMQGIPDEYILFVQERESWQRAFIVVDARNHQSLMETVQAAGMNPQEFMLEDASQVYSSGDYSVFLAQPVERQT